MITRDFIKENWFKMIIVLILIISLSIFFYWNCIRKPIIKHNCYNAAAYWSGEPLTSSYYFIDNYIKEFEFHYDACLKNQGF